MRESIGQYIYGSAARKIQYDVYEENKVLSKKRKKLRAKKIKFKMVITLLFIFCCSMISMYRNALITDLNYKSKQTLKHYNDLKNQNLRKKLKVDDALTLSQISQIARSKFGMHEPEAYQRVAVFVPKKDYIKKVNNN